MSTVTLDDLGCPDELEALLSLDDWARVSALELSFKAFAPGVEHLVSLVESAPLRSLDIQCPEPLPPVLAATIAKLPLETLQLASCVLDGTLETLCAAPALAGLETLKIYWCPALSRDAYSALSNARFRDRLETLALFDSGADGETLRLLFGRAWPRLRHLALCLRRAQTLDRATEALLAEQRVVVERYPDLDVPRARAPTRPERIEAVRALDLTSPSRGLSELWALLEGIDDDLFVRELEDELERALSAWSDDERALLADLPGWGRPMARLARTAEVWGLDSGWYGVDGAPIDFIERARVDVHSAGAALPAEPLARRLPRLEHVKLLAADAEALKRVELPCSVASIDAGRLAKDWLGRGHGARELIGMLSRAAPGARLAWLGPQWRDDARFRGELDALRLDGWIPLPR